MKTIVLLTLGAAWAASLSLAAALPPPPTGYKLEQDPSGDMLKSSHTGEQITATKVNDKWPGCAGDASIHLQYGWENMDGAAAFVDLMAKGPEDPAGLLGPPARNSTWAACSRGARSPAARWVARRATSLRSTAPGSAPRAAS